MTNTLGIKQLYALALAEGEGVGTAYEYYAKRLQLIPWLGNRHGIRRILVAGLPEKYGLSLDFLLLASELGAQMTIVDDRAASLAELRSTIAATDPPLFIDNYDLVLVSDLSRLAELVGYFDLVLSSEILQRLLPSDRSSYVGRLLELASRVALFAPNADNNAHVGRSGLGGLHREEMADLAYAAAVDIGRSYHIRTGYIDMPPFPPGITRTEEQRVDAATGSTEAFAMWALTYYARGERLFPSVLRQRWSHIVYALIEPNQRKTNY